MKRLLGSIIASTLGLWLATIIVPQVQVKLLPNSSFFGFHLTVVWQMYLLLGIITGLLLFFAKPLLDTITLPLRIITMGLFGLIIDAFLIWVVSIIFPELAVSLWIPLVFTTFIIGVSNFLISALV